MNKWLVIVIGAVLGVVAGILISYVVVALSAPLYVGEGVYLSAHDLAEATAERLRLRAEHSACLERNGVGRTP